MQLPEQNHAGVAVEVTLTAWTQRTLQHVTSLVDYLGVAVTGSVFSAGSELLEDRLLQPVRNAHKKSTVVHWNVCRGEITVTMNTCTCTSVLLVTCANKQSQARCRDI